MAQASDRRERTPTLTVAVPTFERLEFLKQTLAVLSPQICERVELLIVDNHSHDGTWDYLESLPRSVRRLRQEKNVGMDLNVIECLVRARGAFTWTLGDDDFPCANAVAAILEAIDANPGASLIFVRSDWQDMKISRYSREPVAYRWESTDRDHFLRSVGVFVTVLSSIVVRRDALDWSFVRMQVGNLLVPAAIALSAVGSSNHALVSDKPLVVCRGGNSGGYDGLTVFTKTLKQLLDESARFGFNKRSRDQVYSESLSILVPYLLRQWSWDRVGVANLVRYSLGCRAFYSHGLPALARAMWRRARQHNRRNAAVV